MRRKVAKENLIDSCYLTTRDYLAITYQYKTGALSTTDLERLTDEITDLAEQNVLDVLGDEKYEQLLKKDIVLSAENNLLVIIATLYFPKELEKDVCTQIQRKEI